MHVDGNAAPIIGDAYGIVGMDDDVDMGCVTGQRFVDRVVDDLINEMMQTARTGRTDVHAGTLADSFQALENLNLTGIVIVGLRHVFPWKMTCEPERKSTAEIYTSESEKFRCGKALQETI